MANEIDSYIKGPAPPRTPESQYTYLEQQLTAVERAFNKQKQAIVETAENNQALYDTEVTVRSAADSALAQSLETLDAKVDLNNTTTQATIQNLQTALADSDSATASKLTSLESKVDAADSENRALIIDEIKTRATKVDALASKVSSIEAAVKTNAADSRSLISQESKARATALSAEASSRTALQSFVGWDGGSYTSNLTQTMETKVSKTDGASYAWAVQGTIDGVTGGLRLAGAKRLNPTTNLPETVTNLIIDANTTINGSLLVAGSVGTNQLANGSVTALKMPDAVITGTKIADGAITTQKIAANAITANLINAQAISADKIAVGTITADKIVAKTLTTETIADNAITGVSAGSNPSGNDLSSCSIIGVPNSQILFVGSVDGSVAVSASTLNLVMSIVIGGVAVSYNVFPMQTLGAVTPVRLDANNLYVSISPSGFAAYGPLPQWNFTGTGMLIPRTGQVQYTNSGNTQIDFYCGVFQGNTRIAVPTSVRVWQFKR